jgi:hypothetical protein
MTSPLLESAEKQSTLWFVTGGVLFVLGWRAMVVTVEYFHESDLVRQLCAVRQFEQDVIPNHANTRLVFCQDTEDGVGFYFCDVAGGKPQFLCEQKEKGIRGRRFTMLGWTADDSQFACAVPDNQNDQELIQIFDGRTGDHLSTVVADPSFNEFGWLSDEAFAYSTYGPSIRVVNRQPNGAWVHNRYFQNVATNNLNNFTAFSASTVAWQDDRGISLFNIDNGSAERVWESTTNRLVEFTHVSGVTAFLLDCTDDDGQYLLWLNPEDRRTYDLGRIGNRRNFIRKATWTTPGSSYAYLTNDLAGSAFCIKTAERAGPIAVPWQGGVRSFTLNGDKLFFSGNPDDHTPGIWEYDIQSQAFKCVVASTGDPLKYNVGGPPSHHALTNSLGERVFYHLWAPQNVRPGQKYPLLLAKELNVWFPYFPLAANCGCYVAIVETPFSHTWEGEAEQTWIEDVSSLYEIMAGNPGIDTNRVYLYADSTGTHFLSRLVNDRPGLAKGAVLFSPTDLPNLSNLKNKRILIVDGKRDADAMERLPGFQDLAAEKGNAITLFLQNDTGHIPASGAVERDRAAQFAKFISSQ